MEEDQPKKTHKISNTSFGFILALAIIGDGVSFLLGLIIVDGGILNSTFAFLMNMSIWLWSAFNGMGYKGAMTGGISTVIEIVPIVGSLPTFTAAVIAIFLMSRVKESAILPGPLKELAKKI